MSRGMSRGGGGFPIIIAVLGVLIIVVIGVFIWMQFSSNNGDSLDAGLPTAEPTPIATQIPTVAPTPEPTPEVTVAPTPEATPEVTPEVTPYVTAAPVYNTNTVWINVDALKIRTQANFDSETVGKIPYAQSITGDISGKWMRVTYEGVQGYIYLGKTSDGTKCVVYSESALEPLAEQPDAPEEDLVSGYTFSENGNVLTLTITFTESVFSDDGGSGSLQKSDFSLSSNTFWGEITHVEGGLTAILTLNMDTGSGSPHVITLEDQSAFNNSGTACTSQPFSHP